MLFQRNKVSIFGISFVVGRVDGEEIAANLFDKMRQQVKEVSPFRDVSCIKVGESAQDKIDHAMEKSMVFIFLHTERAIESDWIKKELRYAQLHNIPILWVQIDGADPDKIRWKPSDRPHLKYNSEQFCNEKELTGIVDEILENSFKLIMINIYGKARLFLPTEKNRTMCAGIWA